MMFVAVGTTNEQRLAVDPQQAATDLHRPKAHVMGLALEDASLLVQQGQGEAIEVGVSALHLRGAATEPQLGAIVIHPFLVNGLGADPLGRVATRSSPS
jgi:hypothetical protein